MKDAGIRIRVEKELRTAFVEACQAEDRLASNVLRDFMQTYVARRQGGQGDLFSGPVRRPEQLKRKPA
ncbi:MAG: plasmid-related protein [Betaproteobacteria bacterium]|nr:plasmid-related protein [Betaproteobacteria bacterium]MCL2885611.1 plasmid-related protein [Betaproteobacteria bacterium]